MFNKLRTLSLFSGIGAFEEALKQLGVLHEIKFACDTGEIELIPIDDEKNRRIYKDLNSRKEVKRFDMGNF